MGKIFSREFAETVANNLYGCYVEYVFGDIYCVRPKTAEAYIDFATICSKLTDCGCQIIMSKQEDSSDSKMAIIQKPADFLYRDEIPGELIVSAINSDDIEMLPVSKEDARYEEGWHHLVQIVRIKDAESLKNFRNLVLKLKNYGYSVLMISDTTMLVNSLNTSKIFSEAEYKSIVA